jgi:acetyl-CoA carboxylase biotin carboxyl carrier protein
VSSGSADPLFDCAGLTAADLSEVLALVAATDIIELDVTLGATRLSLRRPVNAAPSASAAASGAQAEPTTLAIASPLVGIFRPSVTPGDAVEPGQSIGAIEALGMPTSVEAPQSGTVEDLLVADGDAVEYGQPLLILRRTPHGF